MSAQAPDDWTPCLTQAVLDDKMRAACGSEVIGGVRLISSILALVPEVIAARRPWRRRLWSWPWCPWRGMETRTILRPGWYRLSSPLLGGDVLICHPSLLQRVREALEGREVPSVQQAT